MTVTMNELTLRLNLKHGRGTCPSCGYEGGFSARAGRNGSVLAYCHNHCDRAAINDALNRMTGGNWTPPKAAANEDAKAIAARKQKAAGRIWIGSDLQSDVLDTYLTSRALQSVAGASCFRFRGDTPHPAGGKLPAMISVVLNEAGSGIAIHRTYLQRDGSGKAKIEPAKASLGPIWGGAVHIQAHNPNLPLVIGEGIESSASAGILLGFPAWAALSAGNMAKGLVLPPDVRDIIIAADADGAGMKAAAAAQSRWKAEGRTVRVALPDQTGRDFNDILMERAHG